jgi:hypothetical protein
MESCCRLQLLCPICHLLVLGIVRLYPVNETRDIVSAAEIRQHGEEMVNLFFVSVILGQLRLRTYLLLPEKHLKLMLKSIEFWVSKFLQFLHFCLQIRDVQFDLQLNFSHCLGLLFLNLS